jgi:Polyketide cyclase / dehydrase and lipid transport
MAVVLLERHFEVGLPATVVWSLLADVERWPEWAPHLRSARLDHRPLGPDVTGRFGLRPFGSARFMMTSWQPPRSWTWRGRAFGVPIAYHHAFEPVGEHRTRLRWTVELLAPRVGIRARLFARVYRRNLDRAWPAFARWAEARAGSDANGRKRVRGDAGKAAAGRPARREI